jgi:hypothetical protein
VHHWSLIEIDRKLKIGFHIGTGGGAELTNRSIIFHINQITRLFIGIRSTTTTTIIIITSIGNDRIENSCFPIASAGDGHVFVAPFPIEILSTWITSIEKGNHIRTKQKNEEQRKKS